MITIEQLPEFKAMLQELLVNDGFRPKRNEHDDIEFKVTGMLHYFDFDPNDPAYVRLLLPYFWRIDNAAELEAAYAAASQTSERCKGVKVFVEREDSVWASVEFLVESLAPLQSAVLERRLAMIEAGTSEFRRKVEEFKPTAMKGAPEHVTH